MLKFYMNKKQESLKNTKNEKTLMYNKFDLY